MSNWNISNLLKVPIVETISNEIFPKNKETVFYWQHTTPNRPNAIKKKENLYAQ
jgi:hypothetical protein